MTRSAQAGEQRPERGRAGQGTEGQALLVRPAVQDAIDEDRAADDRGRERIAGEQRHERGGRERPGSRNRRGSRNGSWTRRPRMTTIAVSDHGGGQQADGHGGRLDRAAGDLGRADQRQAHQAREQGATRTGPRRRRRPDPDGVACPSPPTAAQPRTSATSPIGHVDVEDPAPGRREQVGQRLRRGRRRPARPPAWTDERIAAPTNGPAAIPRNVSAPMTPEGPRPGRAVVQVGGRGRPDRDQDAAADAPGRAAPR